MHHSPISPIHSTITILDLMTYLNNNYNQNSLLHYENLQQIMEEIISRTKHIVKFTKFHL
jgi:hypothetical protein